METIVSILIILASILLILVVFVQNPKGGGLSTDFGAAHQLGGVKKTNDFVEKATWSLAGVIGILSVVLTIQMKPVNNTKIEEGAEGDKTEQTQGAPKGQQNAPKPANP